MDSNHFPTYEFPILPKSFAKEPHQALLFDGVSVTVPTKSMRNLIFGGAKNKLGAPNSVFSIPFKDIISYSMHCAKPSSKKRVRFKCCTIDECSSEEHTSIDFRFISDEKFPIGLTFGLETFKAIASMVEDCGSSDCCRVMTALEKAINGNPELPIIAIKALEGSTYYLDVEAKNAGQDFLVTGYTNLLAMAKVPNYRTQFTAKEMSKWFDSPIVNETDPDKNMEVLEITYSEYIPHYMGGAGGSYMGSQPENANLQINNTIPIVFDPSVPQSVTAKTALLALLDATGVVASVKDYVQIPGSAVCLDGPTFIYCIKRTDAGGDPALATIKSDYPAFVQAGRTSYVGGVSSYSVSFFNQPTAPAAVGADVISVGACDGTLSLIHI